MRPSCSIVVALPCTGGFSRDAPSERLRKRLMTQTHPERGDAGLGHSPRHLQRDAGLLGRARTRREHAALVGAREQLLDGGPVVAHRVHLGPELAQVLNEVVGERVVVVEDEDPHGQSGCSQASSTARITASPSPPTPRTRRPARRRPRCLRRPARGRRRR